MHILFKLIQNERSMASSSTSSCPCNSSTTCWNYDVFISFRGADVRKTFVDHLYSALVEKGINTYKDDETLFRGESIGPSLLKAIEQSRIAIIVFSKNYADSVWCLEEVTYIMKCMEKREQIVMPIFYDVDPSEVRKQNGEFGDSFTKLELENINKIQSWRKALTDAANISGWKLKYMANGHESKCIKEIVNTISDRLFTLLSSVNNDLIGMGTRLKDLKSQLDIGSGGVRLVGIWGVGGGGKTTLASCAYMEISRYFESYCLVENIREESSKLDLIKLQEKLLAAVLKKPVVVQSSEEGKCMIKSRLCHRKVLVVLDDVDNNYQLEALAGSHDWFGEGSRIIITTRDEHLLKAHKVDVIYGVSLLSRDESIQLFHRHAYREHKPVEDYEMLSRDVISYAGGLPLALKILGSFLYDKDKNEWISALAKLKDIPNPRIMDKLKISYDGLQPDEKELFLDIACFFRGEEIDEAMMILNACGFHSVIGVKVLIQKALISVSDGMFDMHDLVQEMGHYIVKGKHPKNPEKHSRVWQEEDVLNICAMDTTMKNNKIEVLTLDTCLDYPPQCLPLVVANMKKLRWIYWQGYPACSLPTNFQPTKLCCLILERGLQKQLWEGVKHLPSLKLINLGFSRNLIMTPDFDGLPNLERLILCDCEELKELHPSIGRLEKLVFLNLEGCYKLEKFPPIIQLKRLETLILSHCFSLSNFPEIQQQMDCLKHLHLDRSGIKIIPSTTGKYCTSLVFLDLSYCIKFRGSTKFKKPLEDHIDVVCSLDELSLPHLNLNHIGLRFFFRSLRKLNLNHCNLGDGDIGSITCELSSLQILNLRGNKFSRLSFSLLQLPCLKLLNVSCCKNLVELSELPSSIAVLKADYCSSLELIGDISKCKWLWKVSMWTVDKGSVIGGDTVLYSMFQGNAAEEYFISLTLPGREIQKGFVRWLVSGDKFTMRLPHNWYSDFSGFLISTVTDIYDPRIMITIKEEMGEDPQSELWQESNKADEPHYRATYIGYISFSSLRHTTWWNSAYNMISFSLGGIDEGMFGVDLAPRVGKIKLNPVRTEKATTDCSEFWNEKVGDKKTFMIKHDLKSSVEILWRPDLPLYL